MVSKLIQCFVGMVVIVSLLSCNQDEVYYDYASIPQNEWHINKELCFVLDSATINPNKSYFISLEIMHGINYPYKNLFLYINHTLDGDNVLVQDTIEYDLLDDLGKWKGAGNGATRHLTFSYKTNIRLDTTLHNEICIRHAMDDLNLKGIEKIGLKVY